MNTLIWLQRKTRPSGCWYVFPIPFLYPKMIYRHDDDLPAILEHALKTAGSARKLDKMLGYERSNGRYTRHAKRGYFSKPYKRKLISMFCSEAEKRAARAREILRQWQERQ